MTKFPFDEKTLVLAIMDSLERIHRKELTSIDLASTIFVIAIMRFQIRSKRLSGVRSARLDELEKFMSATEEVLNEYGQTLDALFCSQMRKKGHVE